MQRGRGLREAEQMRRDRRIRDSAVLNSEAAPGDGQERTGLRATELCGSGKARNGAAQGRPGTRRALGRLGVWGESLQEEHGRGPGPRGECRARFRCLRDARGKPPGGRRRRDTPERGGETGHRGARWSGEPEGDVSSLKRYLRNTN